MKMNEEPRYRKGRKRKYSKEEIENLKEMYFKDKKTYHEIYDMLQILKPEMRLSIGAIYNYVNDKHTRKDMSWAYKKEEDVDPMLLEETEEDKEVEPQKIM